MRPLCTIQSHILNFQPFVTSFAIFHAFTDLFWAKWPWNWKALQMNSKRFKLGLVSSFHPHSMCERVERVTAKTGRTSCTKWTISFGVSGFSDDNSSVTRALQCYLNLFELRTSFVFSMQDSNRRHQFPTCSDIICCFSVIYLII